MLTTQHIPDGYGDTLVVNTDEQPETTSVTVTYKGKTKRKKFRGEVSHHSAQRWVNDIILPVIHGAKEVI